MFALALHGQANPPEIIVRPDQPGANDVIEVEVAGIWGNSCTPRFTSIGLVSENLVRIEAQRGGCNILCTTVITPYQFEARTGPFPPGMYRFEYQLRNCGGSLTLLAEKTVSIRPGGGVALFPQFAIGGGAETFLTISNSGFGEITADVQLFRSNGTTLLAETVVLPARATRTLRYGGPAGTAQAGWMKVSSDASFDAGLFYKIEGLGNVGVLPAVRSSHLGLFSFVMDGAQTGFAVANPSAAEESVITARIFDSNGVFQGEATIRLGPEEHLAVFLHEPPFNIASNGKVELVSTIPIAAVTLRIDDGILAGVPVLTSLGIDPGSITTEMIADGAVTTPKVALKAVGSNQLANAIQLGEEGEEGSLDVANGSGRSVVRIGAGQILGRGADASSEASVLLGITGGRPPAGALVIRGSNGQTAAGIDGSTGEVFGATKSFVVPDPTQLGRTIRYTAVEGPEAAIYVRGTARLAQGKAVIQLPPHFKALAAESSMTVALTPRAADSRGLAATRIGLSGIEVTELQGGSGEYSFDYLVHAVRKRYENYEVYRAAESEAASSAKPR